MKRLAGIVFIFAACGAVARGPEGMLAAVRTPNNGVPAVVTPGGLF